MPSEDESPLKERLWRELRDRFVEWSGPRFDTNFLALVLIGELILCQGIIRFVSYTEIDWEAYMQEVSMWWDDGIMDYRQIRGGTGPLVYPAGFLYLFLGLRSLTDSGQDILKAQHIFAVFYTLSVALLGVLYQLVAREVTTRIRNDVVGQATARWSWRLAFGLCCLSKRLHSIFVLRLFNDGCAMLLLYASMVFFAKLQNWRLGCFFFSLAVSIKMNILLFAPGLLLLLLQSQRNLFGTITCLAVCAVTQLVLGAPFLLTFPESYLRKAFELDRVFFYKWTVNWKFLSEQVFLSKWLSVLLLVGHLGMLGYLAMVWLGVAKGTTQQRLFYGPTKQLSPTYIVYTMFLSNYIGMVFCRSIHYQFYCWYYTSLPMLLWIGSYYPWTMRLALVAGVEYSFNVFPATPLSSSVLHVVHFLILWSCIRRPPTNVLLNEEQVKEDGKNEEPPPAKPTLRAKKD